MLDDLTDDQRAVHAMALDFAAAELAPFAASWDRDEVFPEATLRRAAALGMAAITVAEARGGAGLGRVEAALVCEALAGACPSTAA